MTTSKDILNNHYKPCLLKRTFKLDVCRKCDDEYMRQCPDYVPDNKPIDNYTLLMVRANKTEGRKYLYKDYQDWIRRCNDEGVI